MTSVIALIILSLALRTSAELTFLSGPLQNASFTVVPASLFIGPSPDTINITSTLIALPFIDPCAPGDLRNLIQDKIVVINEGACSPEAQYDAVAASGPVAILALTLWRPGGTFCYLRDGDVRSPSRIPYLQLTFDPVLIGAFLPGPPITVQLMADPNPWRNLYDSVPYQIGMRWMPAVLFTASAALSWLYLYQHVRLLHDRYQRAIPTPAQNPLRFAQFAQRAMTSTHTALALQAVKTVIVAVTRTVVGYQSSDRLPGPWQRFLSQDLSGYTLIAIQIVSTFWNQIRLRAIASDSSSSGAFIAAFGRFVAGQVRATTLVWAMVVLANELGTSVLLATYQTNRLAMPALIALQMAVIMGIVVIGTQFVVSVIRFRRLIRHTTASGATASYAARISQYVAWLGVTLLVQVLIRFLALNPNSLQPGPFFVLFAAASWSQAVTCVLVAMLLKPRDRQGAVAGSKTGGMQNAKHTGGAFPAMHKALETTTTAVYSSAAI